MKTFPRIIVLVLIMASAAIGFAQHPSTLKLKNDLHQYLAVLHAKHLFSGEILVAKDDSLVIWEPIGLASVENGTPIKTGTNYRIASITKTFTATLILLAQEEKKLNISDKVIDYIDGLSDKFKQVTIQQLLTHSSGLPHHEGIKDYWLVKSKLQLDTKQVIAEINGVDLRFSPGSQWHYSSLGYYLLATILEHVYQDDYEHILKNKILQKLGMTETGTGNALKIIPRMSTGYHLAKDDSLVIAPYRNYSMLKGAGDMYATASDLLKWSKSFFSNDLLPEKQKELLFTPMIVDPDQGRTYGYGWFIQNESQKKYFHGGGTWGYSTYLAFYPEEKISIIILSNVSTLAVESMAENIGKIIYGLPFVLPTVEIPISDSSIDLGLYSGSYVSDSGKMNLSVMNKQEGLFVQLAGNPVFQVYPRGKHLFFGKKIEIELEFETAGNAINGLKVERMGQTFHFKKH